MPDEPVVDTPDTVDLEGLVGGILDERGFTSERSQRLDLLDGLETRLLDAFKTSGGNNPNNHQSSATFDETGFIAKVEALIDSKMTANNDGGNTPPQNRGNESKAGWLGRWLGL